MTGTRQRIDRPWSEYPLGTKALSYLGGYWTKTEHGWRWCTGDAFPTPGADAVAVVLPDDYGHPWALVPKDVR